MMQNTDIILHSISKYPHFNTLIILEDNKEIVILNYEGISFSSVFCYWFICFVHQTFTGVPDIQKALLWTMNEEQRPQVFPLSQQESVISQCSLIILK